MNIFIADDHAIFRQSLTLLLEGRSQHKVVGHAQSFNGLVDQLNQVRPDCILLDYQMPGGDPAAVTKQIRLAIADIKIILLTGIQSGIALNQMKDQPCNGLLHKCDNAEVILQGIERVIQGHQFISPTIAQLIADIDIDLTSREIQIITLMMRGKSLNTIADELAISTRTVEKHKENMMKKLQVTTSIQLVEVAHSRLLGGMAPRQ